MTTDIERELRELFRDKAGEAPLAAPSTPAAAPRQVLRRGRRRQVTTVVGAAAVVALLLVGSIAGVQGLLGRGPEPVPTGDYDVFQRTATVEAFTLTSPSDWYLVNAWPRSLQIAVGTSGSSGFECQEAVPGGDVQECRDKPGEGASSPIPVPHGLPMIQLTNTDLGLDANACRDGLPSDGAVLYIALDPGGALAPDGASLAPYPIGPGLPEPVDAGPCGPGTYAHFTVNETPLFFWIGIGSEATNVDRATVRRTAEMMYADDLWQPTPLDHVTAAYVIAGGFTDAGDPWRVEARPGEDVELSMITGDSSRTVEFALAGQPVTWCCNPRDYPGQVSDVLFGAIQRDASGVEFVPVDREHVPGTIVPAPPTLALSFDLFFVEGTGGQLGEVVAVGLGTGEAVSPSPSAPPTAGPRNDVVELSGTDYGEDWLVRFSGSFADGDACIHVTIAGGTDGPLCHDEDPNPLAAAEPSADSFATGTINLFITSVDPAIVELRFRSDDGSDVPSDFQCAMGPTGWTDPDRRVCVLPLPPQGSGTLEYLDANGTVRSANGMGWGASEAGPVEVPTVAPVHGGVYWAVYPWIGAPGDDRADGVSAFLAEEYGIEAFPGELGCDQGAAEAFGRSDSEHAIGVYFETEEDAIAFAEEIQSFDANGDPMVARVTTYCLD